MCRPDIDGSKRRYDDDNENHRWVFSKRRDVVSLAPLWPWWLVTRYERHSVVVRYSGTKLDRIQSPNYVQFNVSSKPPSSHDASAFTENTDPRALTKRRLQHQQTPSNSPYWLEIHYVHVYTEGLKWCISSSSGYPAITITGIGFFGHFNSTCKQGR